MAVCKITGLGEDLLTYGEHKVLEIAIGKKLVLEMALMLYQIKMTAVMVGL